LTADTDTLEARPEADKTKVRQQVRLLTLADLDKRTTAARRARELIDAIASDLGGDLSTGEQQVAQRASLLGCMAESLETQWLLGEPVDTAVYCTIINAQRRALETVGLKRRARDVGVPSLAQYLEQKETE
jgi:hypothetical protein